MSSQRDYIKQYMIDYGSITPAEAFVDIGCTKLATRISEMIRDGELIHKERIHSTNRYGKPVSYMRYSLEVKPK